jgi:hypothetical protein
MADRDERYVDSFPHTSHTKKIPIDCRFKYESKAMMLDENKEEHFYDFE